METGLGKAFIYIKIAEYPSSFYTPAIVEWVTKRFPKAITFDLDNFSGEEIFSYAIRLVKESEVCVVWIELEEGSNPQKMLGFFQSILRQKEKLVMVRNQENPLLDKLCSILPEERSLVINELKKAKELVSRFLEKT